MRDRFVSTDKIKIRDSGDLDLKTKQKNESKTVGSTIKNGQEE